MFVFFSFFQFFWNVFTMFYFDMGHFLTVFFYFLCLQFLGYRKKKEKRGIFSSASHKDLCPKVGGLLCLFVLIYSFLFLVACLLEY